MSVFSRAGAGIQNILSEWRQPASRSSLCVGSFLFGRESGHSIARPIACGNRVPPQRTVLGETPGTPNTTLTVQAKRLLGRYELPTIQRLTALCSARHPEQAGALAALRAEAERLAAENACCRVSQLAVNGRDLMAAGVRPGPGLRQVLNALLEAVITGQTPNEKDALLAAAPNFLRLDKRKKLR